MSDAEPFSAANPLADPAAYALRIATDLIAYLGSAEASSLVWHRSTSSRRVSSYDSYSTRYEYTTSYSAEVDGWGSVTVTKINNERYHLMTYATTVTGPGGDQLGTVSSDAAESVPKRAFTAGETAWGAQQLRAARGILGHLGGGLE